jgi:hypothetical protein
MIQYIAELEVSDSRWAFDKILCCRLLSADLLPSFRTLKIYQKPGFTVCAFFQDPPIVLNVAVNGPSDCFHYPWRRVVLSSSLSNYLLLELV